METRSRLTHAVSVLRDLGGTGADVGLEVGCSLYREGDLPLVTLSWQQPRLGPVRQHKRRQHWQRPGCQPQTRFFPCFWLRQLAGSRGVAHEAAETAGAAAAAAAVAAAAVAAAAVDRGLGAVGAAAAAAVTAAAAAAAAYQ